MDLLRNIKANYYSIILHIVVVILATEVYVLSMKVKHLNEEYAGVTDQIKTGDSFSFYGLHSYNGAVFPDTTNETAIFLFTTTCPYCKMNVPRWNRLDSIGKSTDGVRAIGICIDTEADMGKYISTYKPTYPIFLPNDTRKFQKTNKIGSVPKTILRNSGGQVIMLYKSDLTKDDMVEMVNAISTNKTNN
jgi:hypothetical protein